MIAHTIRSARASGVFEAVVVEHPDDQDVLGVVPDVDHQPPMVDVGCDQITHREDDKVTEDVERHRHGQLPPAPGAELS